MVNFTMISVLLSRIDSNYSPEFLLKNLTLFSVFCPRWKPVNTEDLTVTGELYLSTVSWIIFKKEELKEEEQRNEDFYLTE